MIKAVLVSCLCCYSITYASAQEPAIGVNAYGQSEMSLIFSAPGTQDELFSKAKEWIFHSYKSGRTVEQLEDKTTGHFLVRAQTNEIIRPAGGMDDGAFSYDLTIDVKDGKARFVVNNLVYRAGVGGRAMLVPSGAGLADTYPANWPTVRKKSFLSRWGEIQHLTTDDLIQLAKSFKAALLAKKDDF